MTGDSSSNVPNKRDSVCVSIRSLCSKTILVESHYLNAFSMLFNSRVYPYSKKFVLQ